MTTTTVAPPVTGQDINLAARATRKALELVLAEQGTSFQPLAVLNVITGRGAALDRDALVSVLANAFDVDAQTVLTLLHGLEARGLVRHAASSAAETVHFELTPDGQKEHQRLTSITGELIATLYRDFDPEDLATTRRVLVTLTERAEAHVRSVLS
ncbi:MAG: winged helix DNA-binding protein [Chloroflexi bacterium]|nr:winged helix DNA-binding protein [Chloroflexota bacterium]